MELGDLLVALIGGTVIGLLGKLVAPSGRDNIPLWLTIICGIGGVLIGTYALQPASSTPVRRASTGGAMSGRSSSPPCW